jgi:large subunit ribosomal protein L9
MKTKRSRVDREGRFKPLPKEGSGVQLLLIQSVDHLGKQGDVVTVKRGYALNYLLPQGLATVATNHHKRMVEKHRARLMEIEKARLASLRQLSEQIAKQSVTIEANANEEGHLYGSVNANEIAAALKAAGFHITTDQVRLEGPLKELGLYTVKIHLHAEIDAELKVWVVPSVASETPSTEKQDKGDKDKGDKAKEQPKAEKPKEQPKAEKTDKAEKKKSAAAAPAAQ